MAIDIPSSDTTVSVQVLDTTMLLSGAPTAVFLGPPLKGLETFTAGAFSFLITHTDASGKQRRLVFDLGCAKDVENDLPTPQNKNIEMWKSMGATLQIDKYVSEILTDHNIPLDSIEGVIWSHAHFDHTGRASLFPSSTSLIVGEGTKATFGPGWPSNESAPFLEREFTGREIVELDFANSKISINSMKAVDYFGDGSFYLLDAPGHMVGHINALARTSTNPDTFLLLTGDSFHHCSQLRPTEALPLPSSVDLGQPPHPPFPTPCPGHVFHSLHPSKQSSTPSYAKFLADSKPDKAPFFTIAEQPDGSSLAHNVQTARETIRKTQDFDADDRVLVIAAHDRSLTPIIEFMPATANEWKQKGWKEKGRWRYLRDFDKAYEIAVSEGRGSKI